jgi:NADPH-dependent F420 reductase
MDRLAFISGTGPEGVGLALRFARAGEPLVIGSRTLARAEEVAARVRGTVPGADVEAAENTAALTRADRIVLAFPGTVLPAFLGASAARLTGKLVIDVLVPLAYRDGFFDHAPPPGAASAGELIQKAAPGARVVSALKNLAAEKLADLERPLDGDVLIAGDDGAARSTVAELVRKLPHLRAVDAGPIAAARQIEAITALLLNLNRRHHALTSIAILGLTSY